MTVSTDYVVLASLNMPPKNEQLNVGVKFLLVGWFGEWMFWLERPFFER